MRDRRTRLALTVAGVLCSLGLGACTSPATDPAPSPSPTSTSRPFVVMSTDAIRVADPAAVTDAASTVLALNVFQRLMTAEPGQDVLKPDAARDCLFTSATTYTCTLNKKLFFHNGDPVTSRDVKFSIERAVRLNVPGSSADLLSSLRKIETPDELTVRFLLSRVDTQFGWALASPSASIVSSALYDARRIRPPSAPIIGSGPFSVTSFSTTALELARNRVYVGHDPGQSNVVSYRRVADSAALEEAMNQGIPDVVWRGLDAAAVTRYTQQAEQDGLTDSRYRPRSLTGVRVRQLLWSPTSPRRANPGLRQAVTAA
ncbi:MAG TPA: ABC transporter substrate-binding protein, partial [Propionibacteriaceae bacterium]